MITYILVGNRLEEPHHHKLENIRHLSSDEIEMIFEANKSIGSFTSSYYLYKICEENYRTISEYYSELCLSNGWNQETLHKIAIKWHALTLNYLSSFRSFVDHHEAKLKKKQMPIALLTLSLNNVLLYTLTITFPIVFLTIYAITFSIVASLHVVGVSLRERTGKH